MFRQSPPRALLALAAVLLIGAPLCAQDGITMSNCPESETVLVLAQADTPEGAKISHRLTGIAKVAPPYLVSRIEVAGMTGMRLRTLTPLPAATTTFTLDLEAFVPADTNLEQDIRLRFYKQEFPGIGHETRFAELHALVIFSCVSETQTPDLVVKPGLLHQDVRPLATATMTDIQFSVLNRDRSPRVVDLSLAQTLGWPVLTPLPASVVIGPGESMDFLLDLMVPGGYPIGTSNVLTLTAAFAGEPASAVSGSWNVEIALPTAFDYADGDGFEVQLRMNGEDPSDWPDHEVPVYTPHDVTVEIFDVFGDAVGFMLFGGSDIQAGMVMAPMFNFMQLDLVDPTFMMMGFTPFAYTVSYPPSVAGTCGPAVQAFFFDRQLDGFATTDAAQPCFF